LGDGPPGFPQGFTCPVVLGYSTEGSQSSFAYRTFTVSGQTFQTVWLDDWFLTPPLGWRTSEAEPRNTGRTTHASFNVRTGFGSSRFARRYSGNGFFFLFLEVLRWFSSLRSLPPAYVFSRRMTGHYPCRVSPFGNPRVIACLQLTEAYRSLPRPSSPTDAKASPVRP
jgi:hypothetical protein